PFRFSLSSVHARFQPAERADDGYAAPAAGDCIRIGRENLVRHPQQSIVIWEGESGSTHSDDRVRPAVNHESAPHHASVLAKALPRHSRSLNTTTASAPFDPSPC